MSRLKWFEVSSNRQVVQVKRDIRKCTYKSESMKRRVSITIKHQIIYNYKSLNKWSVDWAIICLL